MSLSLPPPTIIDNFKPFISVILLVVDFGIIISVGFILTINRPERLPLLLQLKIKLFQARFENNKNISCHFTKAAAGRKNVLSIQK